MNEEQGALYSMTLAQVRNGTGWPEGTRFVIAHHAQKEIDEMRAVIIASTNEIMQLRDQVKILRRQLELLGGND
jgi:hypothetical protein